MVKVDEAFEVKYKKGGESFEVLVDFDKLKEFRKEQSEMNVYDVLADYKIFKDQKKGEVASENVLRKVFPEQSEEEILKEIVLKGECQIPTKYWNELRDEKRSQVINYISESAVNPVTKTKYTPSMIESAVSKVKYNFSPQKSYYEQSQDVLKLLKLQMPISIEKVTLEICVPPQYVGSFYGSFRKFGDIKKEFYDKSANLNIRIEITEAQKDKVIDFVKKYTNNEGSYYRVNL